MVMKRRIQTNVDGEEQVEMVWKPKYKEGDEVPIHLEMGVGLEFMAWGIVLLANIGSGSDPTQFAGTYRVKLTEILMDKYFTHKPVVGCAMTFHFDNIETIDTKTLKYMKRHLKRHRCFVFR